MLPSNMVNCVFKGSWKLRIQGQPSDWDHPLLTQLVNVQSPSPHTYMCSCSSLQCVM